MRCLQAATPQAHVWLWSGIRQQLSTNFTCTPGCKEAFWTQEGKSCTRQRLQCLPRERGEQVDAVIRRCDAEAAVACVGGDGCSMPAALVLAIFVISWAARLEGGLGRQWSTAEMHSSLGARLGGTHRYPAAIPVQLPKVGNHLLETSEIFSFHERVFVGQRSH